ncbi:hypothetical protein OH77DRAFT_1434651 [Trametes cingulata]|nr:hypothetical protein OH77DRAFT_1434651 [Trametes cingulata]
MYESSYGGARETVSSGGSSLERHRPLCDSHPWGYLQRAKESSDTHPTPVKMSMMTGTSGSRTAEDVEETTRQSQADSSATNVESQPSAIYGSTNFGLPPGPTIEDLLRQRAKLFTPDEKAKAWSEAAGMARTYSDEMILRWNSGIDIYLVYAGLFSAILTAFNVQSYQLLQPAAPDPTLAVLQQMSLQLSSFSLNPPFVNSTQPALSSSSDATAPPPVPRSAIWLNALWFSALVLSLASASVGIMVKQWLAEYSSGLSGTSRQAARLRQYRLNNLIKWRVGYTVVMIPVLLQVALGLFFAGLLCLVWTLHEGVAAVVSILVGCVMAFTIVTAVLPLLFRDCAYLSPQTIMIYSSYQRILFLLDLVVKVFKGHITGLTAFKDALRNALPFTHLYGLTRRRMDQRAISEHADALDSDILLAAYDSTLDPGALSAATLSSRG